MGFLKYFVEVLDKSLGGNVVNPALYDKQIVLKLFSLANVPQNYGKK